MKSVFLIAIVAVAMIGVMVPSVFAIASFVDQTKDPLHYIDRYFGEPAYKEWFDENLEGTTDQSGKTWSRIVF